MIREQRPSLMLNVMTIEELGRKMPCGKKMPPGVNRRLDAGNLNSVAPRSSTGEIVIHDTPRTVSRSTTPRDSVDSIATTDRATLAEGWPMIARVVREVDPSAADGVEFICAQFANFVANLGHALLRLIWGRAVIARHDETSCRLKTDRALDHTRKPARRVRMRRTAAVARSGGEHFCALQASVIFLT
jgi:hypothetical protein